MDRRRLLLSLIAISAITAGVFGYADVATAAPGNCTAIEIASGTCPTDVNAGLGDGQATLEGSTTSPGSGDSGDAGNPGGTTPPDPYASCIHILNDRCLRAGPERAVPSEPVTLNDIASFRPDPGVDHMEPNGWMIVGLDTNFFAAVGPQIHDGTLLGLPASVRFTPVGYHWVYGDGTSATRSTKGGTWASQAVAEFDPTPTSHIYRAAGTYYIDLTIDFTAEYQFAGTAWTPIAGTLAVPANRLVATAGNAKTVLVERECTQNPRGPGC